MKEQHGPIPLPRLLPEDVDEQPRPESFRNYALIRRIDVGGMGEVYLARQRNAFDRKVAIKIIRPDLVHDQTARQRFLREAEVTAHLLHEHILPLIEFGEEDGRLFLVTPYIEGGTLAHRLLRGSLALTEAHQLFVALVKAVAYIHRKGVIHRDLKPNNILLDTDSEDGQVYVRLIDFGIASLSGSHASPALTSAEGEVGTVAYMAPERLDGVVAPSNDIYSLGIILYQMLTGTLLSPEERVATLPFSIHTFIRRCTAINPEDRYGSADEMLVAFEEGYQVAINVPRGRQSSSSPSHPLLPETEPTISSSGRLAAVQLKRDEVLLHRGEFVASPFPGKLGTLQPEEYNAPTTRIDP
ncbi:MAG TPA: serine/threonine-protein kinase, partial [Ktedonobacteraceae bacterium]